MKKIYIKNMVCNRCKVIVKTELEKLGLHCTILELGEVEIQDNISHEAKEQLRTALSEYGLELMENKKDILTERIKKVIVEMVSYSDYQLKSNFSDYLSAKLNLDYTYLSNVFSEQQGTTIEHFIILYKINRIKQLINFNELNLTEISWMLNYSSVAHLSTQFKKITGLTPSHFRHLHREDSFIAENM